MHTDQHGFAEEKLIVPSSQAVSCEIGGEAVILDLASGQYFALNAIGAQIWQWLSEPSTAESICERLLGEYDVAPDACRAQVKQLVDQLASHRLVTLETGGAAATALAD